MHTLRLTDRILPLLGVAALHALVIGALLTAVGRFAYPNFAGRPLITILLHPTIRDGGDRQPSPDLSALTVPADVPLEFLQIGAPVINISVERNSGSTITAPTLKPDNPVPLQPYVTQAALMPGEGATVVLRVEVLETGEPGRIEVDASSGSRQVDEAAMDYARAHRWYAGRTEHGPQAMWIRWGVRLQA